MYTVLYSEISDEIKQTSHVFQLMTKNSEDLSEERDEDFKLELPITTERLNGLLDLSGKELVSNPAILETIDFLDMRELSEKVFIEQTINDSISDVLSPIRQKIAITFKVLKNTPYSHYYMFASNMYLQNMEELTLFLKLVAAYWPLLGSAYSETLYHFLINNFSKQNWYYDRAKEVADLVVNTKSPLPLERRAVIRHAIQTPSIS